MNLTDSETILQSEQKATFDFMKKVEDLAAQYARIQLYLYLTEGYPIRYAISQRAACQSAYHSTENSRTRNETETSALQLSESFKNRLQEELKKYFPKQMPAKNQEIIIVPTGYMRRKGITSCMLGSEDGVSANKPNRYRTRKALSYWVDGKLLANDRQKVDDLWKGIEGWKTIDQTLQRLSDKGDEKLLEALLKLDEERGKLHFLPVIELLDSVFRNHHSWYQWELVANANAEQSLRDDITRLIEENHPLLEETLPLLPDTAGEPTQTYREPVPTRPYDIPLDEPRDA